MMKKQKPQQEKTPMQSSQIDLTTNSEELRERVKDPGFLREQWHTLRLIWRLLRDPDVPIYLKLIPVAAVVYLFVPIDLVPDLMVGLGQLDDLTVLLLGAKAFTNMVPQHIVEQHRQAILEEEGHYHTDDDALQDTIVINNNDEK